MQKDRHPKIEQIGQHIPEFPGYRAINFLETDRQLRYFLDRKLGDVRDRLAEAIAGLPDGGKPHHALGESLRRLAEIIRKLEEPPLTSRVQRHATPDQEETLLDFDLNLLDKSAALAGAVENIEREGGGPATQSLMRDLLEDLEDLLAKREEMVSHLEEKGPSRH